MNSTDNTQLSILIPVRNEGLNLRIMLRLLRATVDVPHEVLIVHDHVLDDSIPIVRTLQKNYPNLRLVHNSLGRGVVNAIKSGVLAARGTFVLIFAADEVGPVLALESLMKLANEGCDFVSCTRYAHGGRRLGGSILGGILSRIANRLFTLFTGSALTDCTTGIKLFRRSVFLNWNLRSPGVGWVVAFELAILAQVSGLKIGEVPIISIDRLYGGKSTFRLGPWCIQYLKCFFWGIKKLRGLKSKPLVHLAETQYFQEAF